MQLVTKKRLVEAGAAVTLEITIDDIETVARTNARVARALRLYRARPQSVVGAHQFLTDCRNAFDPDPAHLVDCSAEDPLDYRMRNYIPHSFAMDGERCQGQRMREISSPLALTVAMETYPRVKAAACPHFFTVDMAERIYHRAMFPFSQNGQVSLIVTVVEPLIHNRRLADLLTHH